MKIVKPQSLGLFFKPYTFAGRHYLSVAALGFFPLGAPCERYLAESTQWPHVAASLPAGQPLDEAMPRTGAEVLLLGAAHAPDQQACASLTVQLRLDAADGRPLVSKCLVVCGEREWRADALRARQVGRAKPFLTMPLTYARAFGGPRNPVNPAGCGTREARFGTGSGAMPNVAYPAGEVDAAWRASVPAGFGPIPIGNAARRDRFGRYGRGWSAQAEPGFASDLDWHVFNMAPPDQWLDAPLAGGERYTLRNLHPRHAELTGEVPAFAARAFVLGAGEAPAQAREVAMKLDTLWLVPDHDLGVSIHHGTIEIADSDGQDVAVLMAAYEHAGDPKPRSHYDAVMALRLDPVLSRQHVFNDSQLAPERSAEALARRAARQHEAEQAALARSQQRLDLLDAQYWARRGTPPPADHVPARATLPALGLMTSQTVAEGDFDLSEIVTKAKALADDAERRGKAALASVPAAVPAPVDPAALLDAAFERAARPAHDLLPPAVAGRDPQVESMLAQWPPLPAEASEQQRVRDAASREAIAKLPALKRQSRRAAPKLAQAALPYPPEVAAQLGARVRQWHAAGVPLAGRDLAGADLRGADFSGADLRETMFDGADLRGACFAGANLQGAVLLGARLDGADFGGTNLQGANLCESRGDDVVFDGADLTRAQAIDAQWPHASLRGARLRRLLAIRLACPYAVFDGADASKATLFDLDADDSRWHAATLDKTVFLRARLARADFGGAKLLKSVFTMSDLQASRWHEAVLDGVQAGGATVWRDAVLAGVTARQCGFNGADFGRANLSGARLLRCDLGRSDLRGARLDGGLFARCGLYRADLRDSEAAAAEFYRCLCRKTDFSGARLVDTAFLQCERSGAIPPEGALAATGSPA
ncbi:DUF2169 domain-containing protein [Burkholderia sp. 22PA0099]|uniref:DUF2169 family type VI secretion system accessory protein n=1 Tax=Burkholderia sp. 22PA0099 TaxID=3237372 RepID=UPI0039C459CF